MIEARYYNKLDDNKVQCTLCPHRCRIDNGKCGICLTRENQKGSLVASNCYRPVSSAVDPIEKKPLFHFYPGSEILSMGPSGCNFKCSFCQNYEISQEKLDTRSVTKNQIIRTVEETRSIGLAYTYSEPYTWFETIMDLAPALKEHGKKNVMVTNGFMEQEPASELIRVIDAMNIDIKSMSDSFYKRLCKGSLDPVLRTCEQVKKAGCHLEITNLLITNENDSEEEINSLAKFIAKNLGKDTPLHISRYFPRYKMRNTTTPEITLEKAWQIASDQLDYVYIGNIRSEGKENTYCPSCKELLIARTGYTLEISTSLSTIVRGKSEVGMCKCGHVTNILMN